MKPAGGTGEKVKWNFCPMCGQKTMFKKVDTGENVVSCSSCEVSFFLIRVGRNRKPANNG